VADRKYLEQLMKRLADDGRLIESGWVAMRLHLIPLDAPPQQLHQLRVAYMAGAQYLFSSIIGMLEPGSEETPNDMRRMGLISDELDAFVDEMKLRGTKPQGKA